jgi:tape measure domain-containing protein
MNNFHSATKKTNTAVSALTKNLRALVSTYVGLMGVKAVLNTSDTLTSARNQLNNLPGGNAQLTQSTMDKTYAAAQRSRGNYTDMLSNVGKTMTLAGASFQNNVDNAIRFQEIMSKAYTIGGASAAEQHSSMYQLVQALGSGILQGDELRSVREGAPIAYEEIEKFCQGVLKTDKSLKELGADSLVTSDMVVAAIMSAEDRINQSFDKKLFL